jgi:hypothetical protein
MKRRRAALDASALSWNSDAKKNGNAFEAQRVAHLRDAMGSDTGSSADLSGDRDVGEPRRGSVYHLPASILHRGAADAFSSTTVLPRVFSGAEHARKNNLPASTPFPSASFPNASTPGPSFPINDGPYSMKRSLPRRISTGFTVNENTQMLGPLQIANMAHGDIDDLSRPPTRQSTERTAPTEFGTPREQSAGENPRFWGLEAGGLAVPWTSSQLKSAMAEEPTTADFEALMNPFASSQAVAEPEHIRTSWDDLPRLPTPGMNSSRAASYGGSDSLEGWATALESDYTSHLKRASGGRSDPENLASKKSFAQGHYDASEQLGGSKWAEDFRQGRVKRANTGNPVASEPWTLEETGNGAGVVHIRDPGMRNNHGGNQSFSSPSLTTLDLDEESIRPADVMCGATRESRTPLIARRKLKAGVDKQRRHGSLISTARGGTISRERSAESNESSKDGYFSEMARPMSSRIPGFSKADTMHPFKTKEATLDRSRPTHMTHSSSSNSSSASIGLGLGFGFTDRLDDKALLERRKRSGVTNRRGQFMP